MKQDSRLALAALIALGVFAISPSVMAPVMVGAFIELLGFSTIQAGQITSAEFLGMTAGTLLSLMLVTRVSRRRLVKIVTLLWIGCNLLSIFYHSFEALLLLRAGAGLGMGVGVASVMGAIAGKPNPVRLFAAFMVCVPLFLLGAIPGLQAVIGIAGPGGAYGFLLVLSVLVLLLSASLPFSIPQTPAGTDQTQAAGAGMSAIVGLLVGMLLLFVGFNGTWSYVNQVGREIDLSADTVALMMGIAQVASIGGSFFAGVLNERLGHTRPVTLAILLVVAGSALLANAASGASFAVGLCVLLFGWMMVQPFLMGIAARMDGQGKIATAGTVAQSLGMAGGPYLAALYVAGRPFASVGYFSLVLFVAGLVLVLPSALKANAAARPQG